MEPKGRFDAENGTSNSPSGLTAYLGTGRRAARVSALPMTDDQMMSGRNGPAKERYRPTQRCSTHTTPC